MADHYQTIGGEDFFGCDRCGDWIDFKQHDKNDGICDECAMIDEDSVSWAIDQADSRDYYTRIQMSE